MNRLAHAAVALGWLLAQPALAAEGTEAPNGAAVTVLTAAKSCFSDIVDVSGILVPKEEIAIRPDRPGLKVADVLVDAGETVTAGQILARLTTPDGGTLQIQSTTAGLVSASTAVIGAVASGKGEALFSIIARSEFDFIGQVPTASLPKLKIDQMVRIRVIGAGEMDGRVRRVASTVEPNSQLGQVTISITSPRRLMSNAYARAMIKTGESCGIAVPLTAILYGTGATVVQIVRRQRVEARRVEVGLMSGGRVEIREGLNEGDVVVARAGALLREGDPVRPVQAEVGK
ncbi:HlyD family efflux transporter periplasmic adaptor subunit [Tardiphaga sp. vice352]|uniref:efflux RND transporter periplasmic adaptor subunit n=1 Tax=unclassified Tardiphaga TaxID=2631404 RepID=UPI0011642953|nr:MULTISPECIES: HlyD family efflux transporter periplasmic adaptor subunit [unclassified Tardiphaga]MBC7582383.1 HlyD family efflux transporter periplasmic adaptor subunit [Tardiphaga sp.]QDM19725.1 HlyD family efflux transporter periplasmic adaptor subunit [Tardiphaga sp. vice154]QDM24726.1 HlyD family efflux transporter periplasmic adaptor subunit [Tardiphaga sp. vice304]QDM29918.1 HlyD family efflux transporter periplasmic adaptor subunit [Tardiphaga sp. vice352]